MRTMVQRVLAALMALILLLGQLQPAVAQMVEGCDSSQEPSAQSAQIQEEPSPEPEEKEEPKDEEAPKGEEKTGAEEPRREEGEESPLPEPDPEEPEAQSEPEAAEASGEEPEASDDGEEKGPKGGQSSSKPQKESQLSVPDEPDTEEQTITALLPQEDSEGECTITVSGELPEDAEVVAVDARSEAVDAGVKHVLCAYDITINDGWQPEETVEVTIENEEITGKVHVFHIGDSGKPEEVEVAHTETGEVVFPADGFSIYVVTDELYRRTYEFLDYNGSWIPYEFDMTLPEDPADSHHGIFTSNRQILRNGDSLVVPSMPNKNGMRFLGWYASNRGDLNALKPERGGVKKDITSDSIVLLYARYGKYFTVTYYALPQNVEDNQVFSTQTVILSENAQSVSLDLSEQLYPNSPSEGQGFVGWVEEDHSDLIEDPEHYTLTGNVSLYPRFAPMCKVSFDTASESDEYIPPVWVGQDGLTGILTAHSPTRPGYSFAGWQVGDVTITDAESRLLQETLTFPGGSLTDGRLHLDSDITLKSTWTPQQVNYRVGFWQEKPSDVKKLTYIDGEWKVPEEERSYDYVGTVGVPAEAGSVVHAEDLSEYTRLGGNSHVPTNDNLVLDFTGMRFSTLKNSVDSQGFQYFTVSGDGSSLVHVYYDRDVVSLRFHFPEDVSETTPVDSPEYSPVLPSSGTVTQTAVTAINKANYPEDLVFVGLYGSPVSDGKRDTALPGGNDSAQWPVSYAISDLSYTRSSRSMKYANGQWQQNGSSTTTTVTAQSLDVPTHWLDGNGNPVEYRETFGQSETLYPSHTLEHLRYSDKDYAVSYYKETEQGTYPAASFYSFTAVSGETVAVELPFLGYELDYFTYTDSKGTPVHREGNASQEQKVLTGGSFTNLKVYYKRRTHKVYLHNRSVMLPDHPEVKYGASLATDEVKKYLSAPEFPSDWEENEEDYEFLGWFMDENLTVYVDFAGLKGKDRARLRQKYDNIREIASVYDYRNDLGQTVGAMRMSDGDLHLFAGWIKRRVLVQLEPDGGELPESTPTYLWTDLGTTLSVFPISRDYVPWEEGYDPFVYHIHTYEQSELDNNITDRTARYSLLQGEESATRYAYQPDSYRFLGWFQVEVLPNGNEQLTPYNHGSPVTGDLTLRAQWSRKGIYKLEYDPGEYGTLSGSVTKSYRDHATIALNGNVTLRPGYEGYVFTGWKVRKPHGNGELMDQLYSSGDEFVINADLADSVFDPYTGEQKGTITLVAQYQPLSGTSIAYYVNGGTFVGPSAEDMDLDPVMARELKDKLIRDYGAHASHHYIYDANQTIIGYAVSGIEQNANLTTEDGSWFQRSGYKLMGWSSTPNGSVELELHTGGFNAATDPNCAGHVLYAVWKPEKQVTYNLQGGTWNTANGSEYRSENGNWVYGAGNGEQAPVPYAPTKPGYAFAGWAKTSNAGKGLTSMPSVTGDFALFAVWTTSVVLRFDLNGGAWESVPSKLIVLDRNCYGTIVNAGGRYQLPDASPIREGGYLFNKWEQGSYQYSPGDYFQTSSEQSGQTLTLKALWTEGASALEVLVKNDDTIEVRESDSLVGTAEDGSAVAPGEIDGYQFLFVVYDDQPAVKEDIFEQYRVTAIHRLGDDTYRVTRANGQTKVHYPGSVERLQAIYVQNRSVDVNLVRMNVFEDGLDNMNLTLTALQDAPYRQLDVGKVNIQNALPKPNDYAKVGSTAYRSYTYAIGRQNAGTMHSIDTMTKGSLWIKQTLNGFAFSVNGNEWKDLDRESGNGKDVSVYIIYDNRVETPTTISHTVYGLKSDKEKLFTYQVHVKGRWGFNIGTGAYFLHKPDDPDENLNSYTVALHDGEKVLIPLHIDYISGEKQVYHNGSLFYDMFGNDNPTRSEGQAEKRIWQEVEMRRTSELSFENGSFETSIQMRSVNSNNHNLFNGYDSKEHLWLKQLGISKFNTNTFSHSFIYTRKSLEVPIHVVELTQKGYQLRDEWLKDGTQTLTATGDGFSIGTQAASALDETMANSLVSAPLEDYALQSIQYGLSTDSLEGDDKYLVPRLAAEKNNATLLHLYDYASTDSDTRTIVPDGSGIYLVYYRHSSSDVPVQYVKRDTSGTYTPVDLSGYDLTTPTITVTDTETLNFRSHEAVTSLNSSIEKLDALYLTGRIMLVNEKGSVLTTYNCSYGDWESGREVNLYNTGDGVAYVDDTGQTRYYPLVKVWIEVASNTPLQIVGRLWQRGQLDQNTGVVPYLPKDSSGRIVANGASGNERELVEENFVAFQNGISYATNDQIDYISASLGSEGGDIYSVSYRTDIDGYRYWTYQAAEGASDESLSQILYADYVAQFSPVNVRYVIRSQSSYEEVEDLEEQVTKNLTDSIQVNHSTPISLSDALGPALNVIDTGSRLYRTTGAFALVSPDLKTTYYTAETGDLTLSDSLNGLVYQGGNSESVTLGGEDFPDICVILQPIATLTVSAQIDDEGGYAWWDDPFVITVTLSDSDFQWESDVQVAADTSLPNVSPEAGSQHVQFVNGTATITLLHGQSVAVPAVPRGVRVTFTEEVPSRYKATYQFKEGAKVTVGNSFVLNRHTTASVVNVSKNFTRTGEDFSDGFAYAFLICGAGIYGLYLLLKRRRQPPKRAM